MWESRYLCESQYMKLIFNTRYCFPWLLLLSLSSIVLMFDIFPCSRCLTLISLCFWLGARMFRDFLLYSQLHWLVRALHGFRSTTCTRTIVPMDRPGIIARSTCWTKKGLGVIISVGVLASLQSSRFTRLPIVLSPSTAGIVSTFALRPRQDTRYNLPQFISRERNYVCVWRGVGDTQRH